MIESGRPDRQSEGEPIVENARLPYMPNDIAQSAELMLPQDRVQAAVAEATLPPPLSVATQERQGSYMSAFQEDDAEKPAPSGRGAQKARGPERSKTKEGYVRLRVRLEDGALSVVGARNVEGPLAFDESMNAELVYEVRIDQRRIGIGVIPDAGVMRSFPSPEPQEGQIGHHIVPLRATEFNVRVRAEDLPASALDRLSIDVYQLKARPERKYLSPQPIAEQFADEARLVASMPKLEVTKLEPRVREDLKRALR